MQTAFPSMCFALAILSGAALPWVIRWLAASPLQTSILVGVGNDA